MKEETRKWLEKAKGDLETATYNLKGNKLDASVFYSQQSVEKGLKAMQIEKLGKFTKTHDLLTLAESINAPEGIKNKCTKIAPFYTLTRYPDVEEKIKKSSWLISPFPSASIL